MVPNLRGWPFLPAARPLGTVDTVSNSRPKKRAHYIAAIFIMNKTCLAPKRGKRLKHNICVVQMQCSLFSCVTKANLDSDSAPQPTTLDLNTNSLSHSGPAHM